MACSLLVAALGTIGSLFYFPVTSDVSIHLIWCISGLVFGVGMMLLKKSTGKLILHIVLGILLGLCCYVDLSGWMITIYFAILSIGFNGNIKKEKYALWNS